MRRDLVKRLEKVEQAGATADSVFVFDDGSPRAQELLAQAQSKADRLGTYVRVASWLPCEDGHE